MGVFVIGLFGFYLFNFLIDFGHCAALSVDSDQREEKLTAKSIADLGERLNKPILVLIGKAFSAFDRDVKSLFKNISDEAAEEKDVIVQEMCKLIPCTEWTAWSHCDGSFSKREFGGQNRSRVCGEKTVICPSLSTPRTEYETRLCQGQCPEDYNITTNKFCLKLYNSDQKNRSDAESSCIKDGGHLANTDSVTKQADIETLLAVQSVTSGTFWIDGVRTDISGKWLFNLPSSDPSYVKWKSGEPSNSTVELCKVLEQNTGWFWFDRGCTNKYNYICEIS